MLDLFRKQLKEEGALQPKQEKSSSYANNLLKDTRSHIRPGRELLGKKKKSGGPLMNIFKVLSMAVRVVYILYTMKLFF